MKILVTGVAGFIGSNLAEDLIKQGYSVTGIDNFDSFYDEKIKKNNISVLEKSTQFILHKIDLLEKEKVSQIISEGSYDLVIHLAAKAGVRPSIVNPVGYFKTNLEGTLNLLEAMKAANLKKLIFASSSSVYGNNEKVPFSENDNVDFPISPYAASKKAGELLCHTYHHLFDFDIFCLRFFTVYGQRQRPDLAIHKFTKALLNNEEIPFYGDGSSRRDYTHINDIVQGIKLSVQKLKGFEIINLGESQTTSLSDLLAMLEKYTGKKARLKQLPFQPGDVQQTFADISKAKKLLGYNPSVSMEQGLQSFVKWYTDFAK